MNSFVPMKSEDVLQLCQMAKHVINLKFNIVRKEHERIVKAWENASRLDKLLGRVLIPTEYALIGSERIKQHKLSRIKVIESACSLAENVYLSFEDLEFLKDHEKV